MPAVAIAIAIAIAIAGSTSPPAFGSVPSPLFSQGLRKTAQHAGNGMAQEGDGEGGGAANTLKELYPRLTACWASPPGLARFERTEITARFALRRDGSLIGTPTITFAQVPADTRARAILVEATLAAIRRCTPARITPALGGAVAGRPLSLRFIYDGPVGRGI